jgi:hypothetical protein
MRALLSCYSHRDAGIALMANAFTSMKPAVTKNVPSRFDMDFAAVLCQNTSSIQMLSGLPPSNLLVGFDVAPNLADSGVLGCCVGSSPKSGYARR